MELTWVGHATTLIAVDGYRVLTDPLMTKRVAHLRRRRPDPAPETFDVDLSGAATLGDLANEIEEAANIGIAFGGCSAMLVNRETCKQLKI